MDVFALFTNTPYTFLKIESSEAGNEAVEQYEADGIFKVRDGMYQADNMEQFNGGLTNATLHIKPGEQFFTDLGGQLVGHGVKVAKNSSEIVTYRIVSMVEGFDFDTNELKFYRLFLKQEELAEWQTEDVLQ